jgi:ATP-dependent helicase/DNAse subunit B
MMPRLLIAPAASGKTHYVIDRLREVKASDPFAPVTVILPNQLQLAEFRRRLAPSGGAIGVELLTFHMLYAELLTRVDQRRARLTDPLQIRLLRRVVDHLCDTGQLPYYAALRAKPGFIALLRDTIEELKRARVEHKTFFAAMMGLGPRLEELAAIYTAYQDWLQRNDWADAEGQGWLAAIALAEHEELGRETRLLIVTGFDEFNPTQLGVLTILAQRAQETLITLTGDLSHPRLAHRRFDRARQAIVDQLHIEPEPLNVEVGFRNSELSTLERNLFQNPTGTLRSQQSKINNQQFIEFIEAQNRAEESRAALRWIKQRIVIDGLSIDDVAILARNLEAYRPFLIEVAAEFGVPLRLIGGAPLIDNPAIAALLSLLSLPVLDWPRRQVLEAWRSPYFDWSAQGITDHDVAQLDALTRAARVIGGLEQWQAAFEALGQPRAAGALIDDEDASAERLAPEEVRQLQAKFEAFTAAIMPEPQATIRDYAAFVEDLIGEVETTGIGVAARVLQNPITAARDLAALRACKDALRGLVLSDATIGDAAPLDYRAFVTELRGAIEAMSYDPLPCETGEGLGVGAGVFTASALDARGLSFRAVALLGLSEGEFPQAEREAVLLRETDRAELHHRGLAIEPKLRGDEVTFFYQAVTRTSDRLLLTRPYLAPDGQPWEPSPYWSQVLKLFDQPILRRVRPEDPLSPEDAASPIEWAQAARQFDQHLQHSLEVLQARLADEAIGEHEGVLPQLADILQQRYSPAHGWSASRLEMYGTCPFAFYIAHALQLEPRTPPEAGYDARILGSMLHKILENVYQYDDPLSALPDEARKVFTTAPIDYGFRPGALWDAQQRELEEKLRATIEALAEISEGFTPHRFEQRFGMGQPSLIVRADDGTEIRLHGYIDRLDVDQHGHLRVIDYKASGSTISAKDLEKGKRLQLPLYALAAREALGLGEIASGFYWHILRGEASSFKLEKYPDGIDAAFDQVKQHVVDHVRHIRTGQFQPTPPDGGCPSYCSAVAFCWRYTPKSY